MNLDNLVAFGKAVGDPSRARVLVLLADFGPLCVCELADVLNMPQSTLSTHLQTLRAANLVQTDRSHRWVEYFVDPNRLQLLAKLVDEMGVRDEREVRKDAVRAQARLRLRREGCCVAGFGTLDRHLQEVITMNDGTMCPCGCCQGSCQCGDGCCCGGK